MKPPRTSVPVSVLSYTMLLCLHAVHGAEIPKLFNNIALNLPGSWDGGVVPGTGDVALWNELFPSTVTGNGALSQMGADISVAGIKVTNVGGARNLGGNFIGFHNTNSANTLTIGAGGIDCSTATQTLYGSSKITLGADQTWNIGNANTNIAPAGSNNNEDINFQAQVGATPFNFGGRTLTTTGAGQITIASGYTLSNGTLNVGNNLTVIQGGTNRATIVNPDVNIAVNAGTLRFQSNSGASGVSFNSAAPVTVNNTGLFEIRTNNDGTSLTQSGNITLNQGSILGCLVDSAGTYLVSGGINVAGATTIRCTGGGNPGNGASITGAFSGAGNLTYQNTATNTNGHLVLSGNNSGYTGTININGASGNRRLRIANANAGSAAATWNVATDNVLQVNGVSAQFGTLNGNGSVTNSSTTAAATLNVGAGSFSGIISNGATQMTGLNKIGAGKLQLLGANTYSGPTTVTAGQLLLSSAQVPAAPADFSVADAATLTIVSNEFPPTLQANNVTLGATAGGTLEVALGLQFNPSSPTLKAQNLLVNGTNNLIVSGTNISTGNFPLIEYTTLGGTSGFSGLSLKLPARTTGSLTNIGGVIGVDIATAQQVKWVGNVSNAWDIDPDGTGTLGTPNWKTTVTNAATRYLQGTAGNDIVNFDNTATGSGTLTVNLTTTLSPGAVNVDNSTKDYTFTGTGHITGSAGLTKSGTGSLTLANTTANDYLGLTTINSGTLRLGDGVTTGGGIISGSIVNDGSLILNRPEDHAFNNLITGGGSVEKAGTNTVTFGTSNLAGSLAITGGKLVVNGGGSLTGIVSGAGQLEVAGGTLSLSGFDANTNTGLVTVSAGLLRLEKNADTLAVGGDITITGTGAVTIVSNEQVPNTATINVFGSSVDSLLNSIGTETFANANVNGTPEVQLLLRNFSTITGTATVTQGLLGVASNHTGTVNALAMTSPTALIRVSGNTAASVMNIGTGGITASGGEIQVKYNGNNQDATLNLAGGVATTGNLNITNGGYAGASLNVINLSDGAHTFNIGTGTTTNIAPDMGGTGSLLKTGTGTMTLDVNNTAAHTGGTTVSQGLLLVNGALQGTTDVSAAGTIGGNGTLAGATTVAGTVAPGVATGKLTTTAGITLAAGSKLAIDVASWTGTVAGTDWDLLAADTLTLAATSGNKLTIRVAGTPAGFTESAKTLTIATSANPLVGFDASAIAIDSTGFTGTGTWTVQKTGETLELVYATTGGTPYSTWATANNLDGTNSAPALDPDKDGSPNFLEFAVNGVPLSGTNSGKISGKNASVGGEQVLTLTIPVRSTAEFTGTTEKTLTVDGLTYRVQGSDSLGNWDLIVTEVTGPDAAAIQATLPILQPGWFYRTFRSPGPVAGDPSDFLRLRVDSTN